MKIYQYEHSPFCIPVVRLFSALDLPFETVEVPYGDPRLVIELTDGAYYQVPVLVDDENGGRVVFESAPESQDVARYIDEHFAQDRLFPARLEGVQSLVVAHLENEVEGVTFRLQDPSYIDSIADMVTRTMAIRHKERKFGRGCVDQWRNERDQWLKAAERVLEPYEQMLARSPFLLGKEPVYSDFLLYGILGNLTYKGRNAMPERFTALIAWEERMRKFRF